MLESTPRISVLVTFFNQKKYTERVLMSILNQSYKNLEIIIGDDHSEDDLEEIVKSYSDDRIKYVRNYENLGRSAQYRKLLNQYASGDFVTVVNADDYFIDLHYFEKAMAFFTTGNEPVLVYGKVGVLLEEKNQIIKDRNHLDKGGIMDGNHLFMKLMDGISIPHISSIYNRKKALELDFYRSNDLSQDWESLYRLIIGNYVAYVNDFVALYGRHSANVSKLPSVVQMMAGASHIEAPFSLASEQKIADAQTLLQWKNAMLVRYFRKNYVKLSLLNSSKIQDYLKALDDHFPEIALKIRHDNKLRLFDILKRFPKLLIFASAITQGQTSVVRDLLMAARANKAKTN